MALSTNFSWAWFFRKNAWFFGAAAVFLFLGITWLLVFPKGELIWFFNARRSPAGDLFFRYFTRGGETEGFVIVLIALLFIRYRWALAFALLTGSVSLISNLSKSLFKQPRPARYFEEVGLFQNIIPVDGEKMHHGLTSLPSGHTMAAFAFFAFLAFCLPLKRGLSVILFLVAFLVGLSRVYLVQHFEEDVLLGAVMGMGLALLFYRLFYSPDQSASGWNGHVASLLKKRTTKKEA